MSACDYCGEPINGQGADRRVGGIEQAPPGASSQTDETTGMNRYGPVITAAGVVIGLALQFLVGGIWGFMLFALVLMVGVYLAYG